MKSFIVILVWTFIFLSFGIYLENEIEEFTDKYTLKIDNIEKEIINDNFEKADKLTESFLKEWKKDSKILYMILNNEYFDSVHGFTHILKDSIYTKDKTISLEYIEKIKMNINNIIQYEQLDLTHIL